MRRSRSRTENMAVTPLFFVETWQRASSVEEVCERTGASRRAILQRARIYREIGVRLKPLLSPLVTCRGRKPLDVDELNRVADAIVSGEKSARR